MNKQQIKTGHILLSEPFMADPNFKRSAVLICDHGDDGTVGFVMNKPLDMSIDALIADFPTFDSEVFFGGPVQTDTIHYVHCKGDILEESMEIVDGVYWGGNFSQLKTLIQEELISPKDIRFFVGYSGWGAGQLDDEMRLGSWVTAEMDANYLFKSMPNELWQQVMENKGSIYTVIAQMPESANWN